MRATLSASVPSATPASVPTRDVRKAPAERPPDPVDASKQPSRQRVGTAEPTEPEAPVTRRTLKKLGPKETVTPSGEGVLTHKAGSAAMDRVTMPVVQVRKMPIVQVRKLPSVLVVPIENSPPRNKLVGARSSSASLSPSPSRKSRATRSSGHSEDAEAAAAESEGNSAREQSLSPAPARKRSASPSPRGDAASSNSSARQSRAQVPRSRDAHAQNAREIQGSDSEHSDGPALRGRWVRRSARAASPAPYGAETAVLNAESNKRSSSSSSIRSLSRERGGTTEKRSPERRGEPEVPALRDRGRFATRSPSQSPPRTRERNGRARSASRRERGGERADAAAPGRQRSGSLADPAPPATSGSRGRAPFPAARRAETPPRGRNPAPRGAPYPAGGSRYHRARSVPRNFSVGSPITTDDSSDDGYALGFRGDAQRSHRDAQHSAPRVGVSRYLASCHSKAGRSDPGRRPSLRAIMAEMFSDDESSTSGRHDNDAEPRPLSSQGDPEPRNEPQVTEPPGGAKPPAQSHVRASRSRHKSGPGGATAPTAHAQPFPPAKLVRSASEESIRDLPTDQESDAAPKKLNTNSMVGRLMRLNQEANIYLGYLDRRPGDAGAGVRPERVARPESAPPRSRSKSRERRRHASGGVAPQRDAVFREASDGVAPQHDAASQDASGGVAQQHDATLLSPPAAELSLVPSPRSTANERPTSAAAMLEVTPTQQENIVAENSSEIPPKRRSRSRHRSGPVRKAPRPDSPSLSPAGAPPGLPGEGATPAAEPRAGSTDTPDTAQAQSKKQATKSKSSDTGMSRELRLLTTEAFLYQGFGSKSARESSRSAVRAPSPAGSPRGDRGKQTAPKTKPVGSRTTEGATVSAETGAPLIRSTTPVDTSSKPQRDSLFETFLGPQVNSENSSNSADPPPTSSRKRRKSVPGKLMWMSPSPSIQELREAWSPDNSHGAGDKDSTDDPAPFSPFQMLGLKESGRPADETREEGAEALQPPGETREPPGEEGAGSRRAPGKTHERKPFRSTAKKTVAPPASAAPRNPGPGEC